jgi:hypothetical protein
VPKAVRVEVPVAPGPIPPSPAQEMALPVRVRLCVGMRLPMMPPNVILPVPAVAWKLRPDVSALILPVIEISPAPDPVFKTIELVNTTGPVMVRSLLFVVRLPPSVTEPV